MFRSGPKEAKSRPFSRRPPVSTPSCRPTLLLGLPNWVPPELDDVLRNDLMYSSRSSWNWNLLGEELKLLILQFCDGDALLLMTKAWGGSCVVSQNDIYHANGKINVSALAQYQDDDHQAVVVDDNSMVHEPAVARFVVKKFRDRETSVVIMSIVGLFEVKKWFKHFGVDWSFAKHTRYFAALHARAHIRRSTDAFLPPHQHVKGAVLNEAAYYYVSRYVRLTDRGHQILSTDAFSPSHAYVEEAAFVENRGPAGGGDGDSLFVEYVESSDEKGKRRLPPPSPGSPVICAVRGNKSVSYFGFVNTDEVSYGAIILRLCYAAQYAAQHHHHHQQQQQQV